MDYLISDIYVYGTLIVLLFLIAFAFLVRKTSWNYVSARIKQFFTGGAFVEEVDSNNKHNFTNGKQEPGMIILKETAHNIRSKSALRNPDGLIFQVHKDLGPTVNPNSIHSANNLVAMGFKNIRHAIEFYKNNYFREEYEKIKQEITATPSRASVLINGVEKEVGLSLMSPTQNDQFTMDLSILYNWSNEDVDGRQLKNALDNHQNEIEKRNTQGMGFSKLLSYVMLIAMLLGVLTFCLVVLNGQGLLGGNTVQTVATLAPTTTMP